MISIKKIVMVMIVILILTQITIAQNLAKEADAIIGTWKMPDDWGVIKIFKEGEFYNGKIVLYETNGR